MFPSLTIFVLGPPSRFDSESLAPALKPCTQIDQCTAPAAILDTQLFSESRAVESLLARCDGNFDCQAEFWNNLLPKIFVSQDFERVAKGKCICHIFNTLHTSIVFAR
jgi:hypothetical protein